MMAAAHAQTCTDPAHHVHAADDYLREVDAVCRERGLRLTELRGTVLRLIATAGHPVKAYELLELMRDAHGPAAPPTVYRALDFLLESGFIHKLQSINAFVGCHHPRIAHSVPFLICDRCSNAIELEAEEVPALLTRQAQALGFEPARQTLEVHGVCADCRDAA